MTIRNKITSGFVIQEYEDLACVKAKENPGVNVVVLDMSGEPVQRIQYIQGDKKRMNGEFAGELIIHKPIS